MPGVQIDRRRRSSSTRPSEPDGRLRSADPDRRPGGGPGRARARSRPGTHQNANVNARIDDVQSSIRELRADIRELREIVINAPEGFPTPPTDRPPAVRLRSHVSLILVTTTTRPAALRVRHLRGAGAKPRRTQRRRRPRDRRACHPTPGSFAAARQITMRSISSSVTVSARPVVQLRRPGRRVAGNLLRVLQRPTVRQIRRDARRTERVAARHRSTDTP